MMENSSAFFSLKNHFFICIFIIMCPGIIIPVYADDKETFMISCFSAFESSNFNSEYQNMLIFDVMGKSYELADLRNGTSSSTIQIVVANCTLRPGFFKFLDIAKLNIFFSFARITVLVNNSFNGACAMERVLLRNNNMEVIEPFAFSCLKNIKMLLLYNNEIRYLPVEAFKEMENLEILDISNNSLQTLSEGIFDDLISLSVLSLSSNAIAYLPDTIFHQQKFLTALYLQQNNVEVLNKHILSNLRELNWLDISNNKLKNIDRIFFNNEYMEVLNISKNEGLVLHSQTFSGLYILETLLLIDCNISILPTGLFANTPSLSRLILSHNRLSIISPGTFVELNSLIFLDLSYNYINEIQAEIFLNIRYAGYLKIDLQYNKVKKIHIGSLDTSHSEFQNIVQFDLTGNPFECDCHAYKLYSYLKNTFRPNIEFQNSFTCAYPENNRGKNLVSLEHKDFICNISEYCPENCICIHRESDYTKIMNCSNVYYKYLPTMAPFNTSILDISHNNLTSLSGLNNTIWENLTEVHAEYNQIISTGLYIPRKVNILKLHSNNLTEIPRAVIKYCAIVKDIRITLANNAWQCNCSILPFKKWLSNHIDQVTDISDINCRFPNNSMSTASLIKLTDTDICSNFIYVQYIISLGVTVLLVLTLIFYYRYKIYILSFLYSHCNTCYMLFFCNRQIHENKLFDCFIAYSSSDRDITLSILEEFETKPPYYKFCIHERNWLPGRYITSNIVNSVQQSRKTLIIISEAFLKSKWFYLEFQAAYYQTLQDKTDRLLFVIKGDFPGEEQLKRDVRQVILSKTYLKWEEPWFWEKLRFAIYQQNAFTRYKSIFSLNRLIDSFKKKDNSVQQEMVLLEVAS